MAPVIAAIGVSAGTAATAASLAAAGVSIYGTLSAGQAAADGQIQNAVGAVHQSTENRIRAYIAAKTAKLQKQEFDLAAQTADLEASAEYQAGMESAAALRAEFDDVIAQQQTGFAAAGVDAFSGTAAAVQDETDKRGSRLVKAEQTAARARLIAGRRRGLALRREGEMTAFQIRQEGLSARARAAHLGQAAGAYGDAAGAAIQGSIWKALGTGLNALGGAVNRG